MKVLVTGGSGYLGSLIVKELSDHPEIDKIFVIDFRPPKILWKPGGKIYFIQKNLVQNWEEEVKDPIEAIVHSAFHIRRPYFFFKLKKHLWENSFGLEKILSFANERQVSKIIALSSIAVYGAYPSNDPSKPFKEEDPLREKDYLYGQEKILMEQKLKDFSKNNPDIKIVILRLGTVTGPFAQKHFKKGGLLNFLKNLAPIIPLTSSKALRQYVHEDDVIRAILFSLFTNFPSSYEVFNVAPPSFIYFSDIAKLLGKKTIFLPYNLAKILFFLAWHLSLGKIPTAPGSINSYSFPIVVDGSKITRFGFNYEYSSLEAFQAQKGKYLLLPPES